MRKQVNIRVPDKTEQELEFLHKQLGISKTAIIILAIRRLAHSVKRQVEKGKE